MSRKSLAVGTGAMAFRPLVDMVNRKSCTNLEEERKPFFLAIGPVGTEPRYITSLSNY